MKYLVLVLALCIASCGVLVDKEDVILAVAKQGYSDVKIMSSSYVMVETAGCSSSDSAAFEVSALNPLGKRVKLIACAGWPFKGVTIRTR